MGIVTRVKIHVITPEHSQAVQEYLFSQGVTWPLMPIREVRHTDSSYLFVDGDGVMTKSDDSGHFEHHSNKEMKFDFAQKITAVPRPRATTVLFGKTYDREELQKALDKLTPVQL